MAFTTGAGSTTGSPPPANRPSSNSPISKCSASATSSTSAYTGYYYVLFEDPDGIRLEVNFVPGAGLLAESARFNPATGYV